jgi:hypothetical protein
LLEVISGQICCSSRGIRTHRIGFAGDLLVLCAGKRHRRATRVDFIAR